MNSPRLDLLRWQSAFTWSFAEYHLERLVPEDVLWEPAGLCWTLRPDGTGGWVPDWADSEPDPVPVPTIAWLSWHIGWWLGVATDHLHDRTPRDRADVRWPGPEATVSRLRAHWDEWTHALDQLTEPDLDRPCAYPWGDGTDRTLAHTVAWANAELMKNVAEIGQLRLQHVASGQFRVPAG
ncbi:DinB family protein [Streptomyces sp. NPDC059477]|uniref:DinB family protein n=1 Tax=Streptomyces sp. NPDC059477 TaxID=3346847 RepID=UPI003673B2C1